MYLGHFEMHRPTVKSHGYVCLSRLYKDNVMLEYSNVNLSLVYPVSLVMILV